MEQRLVLQRQIERHKGQWIGLNPKPECLPIRWYWVLRFVEKRPQEPTDDGARGHAC